MLAACTPVESSQLHLVSLRPPSSLVSCMLSLEQDLELRVLFIHTEEGR